MKYMKKLFIFSFLLNVLILFLGFFPFLHPLFDSFTHFRVYLLFSFLVFFLVFIISNKQYRLYLIFVFFLVLSYTIFISLAFNPSLKYSVLDNNKTLKLMQFNLNFRNTQIEKFSAFIAKEKVEVITLQEVTSKHKAFLETLKIAYPYQAHCKFGGVGDIAILSVYPFAKDKGECVKGEGLLWKQVLVKDKAINIASVHLHWPFPYKQEIQVKKLVNILKQANKPMILAGDFNAVSWSHSVQQIAKASQTECIAGLRWTLNLKKLPILPRFKLPIDHILISKEIEVINIKVAKDLGSDHLPLLTTLVI